MKRAIGTLLTAIIVFLLAGATHVLSAPASRLTVATGQEPSSIDQSLAGVGGDYTIVENYGEYLIQRTPNGDLKPGLAASWKVSPDGKIVEFTLRKGVKFHSGDAFTAKDVEFSFERGRAKNQTVKTRLRSVDRFEVVDDFRFKIYFKAPDVTFIPGRAAAMIVSKTYYDKVGEEKFVRNPVGTGPYKFASYTPGESIDIERFDGYWGEKPSVKEARFIFVAEDITRVAKLKTKEVDMITTCPYPLVSDLEKTPNLKIVRLATNHPSPSVVFANRNPKTPWHDKRVRMAMAHAINYDSILKNVFHGIPNRYPFLAPYELGYDPQLKPYTYDPQRAKKLLAEAGYPNGFDLNFYWIVTGRFPFKEAAEAIASYFEAVGIRTKLIGEEPMKNLSRHRSSKTPEAEYVGLFSHGRAGGVDPTQFMDLMLGSEGGFSVYSNPQFDKIVEEAKAVVEDKKRAVLIKKAVAIAYEDVAAIPLCNAVMVYAMQQNIDFKPTQKHYMELVMVKDVTIK
jgi:peptide/nickel transport system substrate-binding protein